MAIKTKSEQVIQILKKRISSSEWQTGQRIPNEYDLVEELGVSRATIREALSVLARDGLVVRKPGMGTHVAARTAQGTIAIVVRAEYLTSPAGFYHRGLFEALRSKVEADGYRAMLVLAHGETTDSVVASGPLLDMSYTDNLLGVITDWSIGTLESEFQDRGVPVVTVESVVPEGRLCVVHDFLSAYNQAVSHLVENGHTDFSVMYIVPPDDQASAHILRARMQLLNEITGYDNSRLVPVNWSLDFSDVTKAFRRWWSGTNKRSAILLTDDAICDVACWAMLDLGIKVPEELSIVTLSNHGRQYPFPTEFTRVEFDPMDTASIAWSKLKSVIDNDQTVAPVSYVQPQFVQGASVLEKGVE